VDVNFTIAIPIATVLIVVNTVMSFIRLKNSRSENGAKNEILRDLKDGHKYFGICFKELTDSNIRSEAHLNNMVRQLQDLNNNWRK